MQQQVHRWEEALAELNKLASESFFQAAPAILHLTLKNYTRNSFQHPGVIEQILHSLYQRLLNYDRSFEHGKQLPKCWYACYHSTQLHRSPVQQQYMALNALLNFDLGFAAAETAPPSALPELEKDFAQLAGQICSASATIRQEWMRIGLILPLLERTGAMSEHHFSKFNLEKARKHAWVVALRFARTRPECRAAQGQELDHYVNVLHQLITRPGLIVGTALWLCRWLP